MIEADDRVRDAQIRLRIAELKVIATRTTLEYWKIDGHSLPDELRAEAAWEDFRQD